MKTMIHDLGITSVTSFTAIMSLLSMLSRSEGGSYEDMLRLAKLHMERSKVPYAVVSPDEHIIMCNEHMEDFLGRSQAQLQEVQFREITHPDFIEDDVRYFHKILKPTVDFGDYKLWKIWIKPGGDFAKGTLEAYPIMLGDEVIFVIAIVVPDDYIDIPINRMSKPKENSQDKGSKSSNIFLQALDSILDVGRLIRDDKQRFALVVSLVTFMLVFTVCVFLILSREEFWQLMNTIFVK